MDFDWEASKAVLTPETRLFILCNPHNSVGRIFRRDELALNDEKSFRHGGQGFVRLNFACPRAMLVETLGHIKTALLQKESAA